MTLQEIKKEHEELYKMYDLGSPKIIKIDILGTKAVLTDSNQGIWGKVVHIKELGKKIAYSLMIELEATGTIWGGFATSQFLPEIEKVLDYDQEDFWLDKEVAKVWVISRIVCNIKRKKGTTYSISYDGDSGMTWFEER